MLVELPLLVLEAVGIRDDTGEPPDVVDGAFVDVDVPLLGKPVATPTPDCAKTRPSMAPLSRNRT